MTINELEGLRKLQVSVQALKFEIQRLEASSNRVSDIVRGSRYEIPYDVHNISVTGHGSVKYPTKKAKLRVEFARCRSQIVRAEKWLEALADGEIKSIIKLRYFYNVAWADVVKSLYPNEQHDESYPRKKVEAYFKNLDS